MSHPPQPNANHAQDAELTSSIAKEQERKPSPLPRKAQMGTLGARIGIDGQTELSTFPNSNPRGDCTSNYVQTAHSAGTATQRSATAQAQSRTRADHAIVAASSESSSGKLPSEARPLGNRKVSALEASSPAPGRIPELTRKSGDSFTTSKQIVACPISVPMQLEGRTGTKKGKSDQGGSCKVMKEPTPVDKNQSKRRRKRVNQLKAGQTAGRWTPEEHKAFLEGLKVYGREWKKVADRIPTRTSAQIRSHAQKYFAKMARDEAIMMEQSSSLVGLQAGAPPALNQGAEGTGAVVASNLPPAVQRNVDRILADPEGAQEEVEHTLNELRERYQQLQIRLQETQRPRQPVQGANRGAEADNIRPPSIRDQNVDRRKRSLEDAVLPLRQQALSNQNQQDDLSSVASSVSASLANASIASNREFGNEELIALHVLGGSLPRSASNQSLANETNGGSSAEQPPAGPGGESPTSSLSSVARDGCDIGSKRQRFEDDRP